MENKLLHLLIAPLLVGSIILGIHELLLVLLDFPSIIFSSVKLIGIIEVKVLRVELLTIILKYLILGSKIVNSSPIKSRFLWNRLIADGLISTVLFSPCCFLFLFLIIWEHFLLRFLQVVSYDDLVRSFFPRN